LISPDGKGRALPAYPLVIIVHPTNFGTFALVIAAIALGLFVTASAFRAIRNGRPGPPLAADSGPDLPATPPGLGESTESASPDSRDRSTVSGGHPVPVRSPSGWIAPPDLPYPTTDGAAIAEGAFPDPGNWPEHTDSVDGDGSELASADPSVLDQESASPSRRATEEPR